MLNMIINLELTCHIGYLLTAHNVCVEDFTGSICILVQGKKIYTYNLMIFFYDHERVSSLHSINSFQQKAKKEIRTYFIPRPLEGCQ